MTPTLFSELGLSAEVLKASINSALNRRRRSRRARSRSSWPAGMLSANLKRDRARLRPSPFPRLRKVDTRQRAVQVLILCPTRELAIQVSEEVHRLALFKSGIHALPIYGGQSFERQLAGFKQGANIVIGTPGRVMDHMRRGTLKLSQVKMVVLDEVDVMLNMGVRDDIEIILQDAPAERQTVFFLRPYRAPFSSSSKSIRATRSRSASNRRP